MCCFCVLAKNELTISVNACKTGTQQEMAAIFFWGQFKNLNLGVYWNGTVFAFLPTQLDEKMHGWMPEFHDFCQDKQDNSTVSKDFKQKAEIRGYVNDPEMMRTLNFGRLVIAKADEVRSDINSHGLNTLYKMTENLTSKSGVANETARMQAIKMRWFEYDLSVKVDNAIVKHQQVKEGGLNRENEYYKTTYEENMLKGIEGVSPTWWNVSWFVFCLAGRPAGNMGLPILMSGRELLLAEQPTTENPAGSFRARTALTKLKQDGLSGRLVRRTDATIEKAIIRVRNEAVVNEEDPDAAESAFTKDVLGTRPGGKKGGGVDKSSTRRLEVHHHKEKVESPELKKLSDYLKRKHAQVRTTDFEIADLLAQSPNAERTAEIKRLREDKVALYKQIRRGNDKMDEIAEVTIFGTVAEQPPLSSGIDLSRTARRQILTTPRNAGGSSVPHTSASTVSSSTGTEYSEIAYSQMKMPAITYR